MIPLYCRFFLGEVLSSFVLQIECSFVGSNSVACGNSLFMKTKVGLRIFYPSPNLTM
uniref:Uncharacterized protein n=1 Tax=Rhizophora mucronata TaxID=61149 RepID=A0A2P2NB79_RHIMU